MPLGDRLVLWTRWPFPQDPLWVTDGTPEGTKILAADIPGEFEYAQPWNHRLFFPGSDPEHGRELWLTDGTPEGTGLLKDIFPGKEGALPRTLHQNGYQLGERFIFSVADPEHGMELWTTDGTRDGTTLLKDIFPGSNGSEPLEFIPLGDRLLFTATDPDHGTELWATDGTRDGTVLLKDIYPGPGGGIRLDPLGINSRNNDPSPGDEICGAGALTFHSFSRAAIEDRVYFTATDPENGDELWESDGTPEGTQIVANVVPGSGGSAPGDFKGLDGVLYFTAHDAVHGRALWGLRTNTALKPTFHRGDPNSSGTTDISDGIAIFGFLFLGNPATLSCKESADANNEGTIDISDGIYLLQWLFTGGPAPAAPGPTGVPCGLDPDPTGSPGDLGCESYSCK